MKIENQVSNLELSRKLKDLRVEQESLFWWNRQTKNLYTTEEKVRLLDTWGSTAYYSAFTVAELGEMLPRNIKIECGICTAKEWRVILFEKNLNECSSDFMKEKTIKITDGFTEANARAKMLIYLLEKKLISG